MTVFHTPMVTLSDGNLIPQIGLGVLRIDDEGVTPVVESALEAGFAISMALRGTITRLASDVRCRTRASHRVRIARTCG